MIVRTSNTKNLTINTHTPVAKNCGACSVRTIIEETENIDKLQTFIDYLNAYKLHSFKVRLVIDEPEPVDETAPDQGGLI